MTNQHSMRQFWLVIMILALGISLRMVAFSDIPPGLHRDEASVGYETLALLETQHDRWNIPLPVYFISWGSGQSVLYSYLSLPSIALFGLSRFSVRLISLAIAILTLPLAYVTVYRALGQDTAILTLLLLAIQPWHIMISRWALDANLLPFFLLLGVYTVARALARPSAWSALVLIPWALGLYAYAVAYVVVPLLVILVAWFYRATITKHRRIWLGAFGIFSALALPIGLFLLKNFASADWVGEQFWGLGIPRLPFSRLAQISAPPFERWLHNFFFVVSGFQDNELVNTIPGLALIFHAALALSLLGAGDLLHQRLHANLFFVWFGACLPLLVPWQLTSTHINAMYLPLLALAAFGFLKLQETIRAPRARRIFIGGLASICAAHLLIFVANYYFIYPKQPEVELAFDRGLERALGRAIQIAPPHEPILITDRIILPYILVAFHSSYPPAQFQRAVRRTFEHDAIQVQSVGRFYFGADNLDDPRAPFTFVLTKWDDDPCTEPRFVLETRLWKVGKCN